MGTTDLPAGGILADLRRAVDAVTVLDPAAMSAAERAIALVELSRAADRLRGAVATVSAECARANDHRAHGACSPAAWISSATGLGWGRARQAVELGEAMGRVPELDDAVRSGRLSPEAAHAVVPAIDDDGFPEVADRLVDELSGKTPRQAGRHIEEWRAVTNPVDDIERRRAAADDRTLVFRPLADGTTHLEGVVPNHIARNLRLALAHLAEQQRLDDSGRTRRQRTVDALGDLAAAYNRGEVTGGRNVPRLIVIATLEQLESGRGVGTDTLTREVVTSTDIDRLCCDSVIHRFVADQPDARLRFGRGRRTASPNQWLAMVARDRGCRHPGCDRPPQWCEAHHLREFATRGGLTDIDEMVLLCHHHHHALHDAGWEMSGTPAHLVVTGPDGQTLHGLLPRHDTNTAAA